VGLGVIVGDSVGKGEGGNKGAAETVGEVLEVGINDGRAEIDGGAVLIVVGKSVGNRGAGAAGNDKIEVMSSIMAWSAKVVF
jgi:hypothetical protein